MRLRGFAIAFAVAYSIAYVVSVLSNYALFTYHPAIGELGAGVEKGRDGPAMYWYGWVATSGVIASLAGVLAELLPESVTRRLWSGLTWMVALMALAVLAYDLRQFFLK